MVGKPWSTLTAQVLCWHNLISQFLYTHLWQSKVISTHYPWDTLVVTYITHSLFITQEVKTCGRCGYIKTALISCLSWGAFMNYWWMWITVTTNRLLDDKDTSQFKMLPSFQLYCYSISTEKFIQTLFPNVCTWVIKKRLIVPLDNSSCSLSLLLHYCLHYELGEREVVAHACYVYLT